MFRVFHAVHATRNTTTAPTTEEYKNKNHFQKKLLKSGVKKIKFDFKV